MNYFFTSDMHLGHANIMKYCGRTTFMTPKDLKLYLFYKGLSREEQKKFKLSGESLEKMNIELVKRWNERVKPEDTVFNLGDFCFKSANKRGNGISTPAKVWEGKLKGKIIHIKGNHDKNNSNKTVIQRIVIAMGGHRINLVHNPEMVDVNYSINFVGHIHKNWKIKRIRRGWQFTDAINVGVDVWDYRPISLNEIMKRYYRWKRQNNV